MWTFQQNGSSSKTNSDLTILRPFLEFPAYFACDVIQKTADLTTKDRRNCLFKKDLRPQFCGFFKLADFEGAYKNRLFSRFLGQTGLFLYLSRCKNSRATQKCHQICHIYFILGMRVILKFTIFSSGFYNHEIGKMCFYLIRAENMGLKIVQRI